LNIKNTLFNNKDLLSSQNSKQFAAKLVHYQIYKHLASEGKFLTTRWQVLLA